MGRQLYIITSGDDDITVILVEITKVSTHS